jgi:hypothetical protein
MKTRSSRILDELVSALSGMSVSDNPSTNIKRSRTVSAPIARKTSQVRSRPASVPATKKSLSKTKKSMKKNPLFSVRKSMFMRATDNFDKNKDVEYTWTGSMDESADKIVDAYTKYLNNKYGDTVALGLGLVYSSKSGNIGIEEYALQLVFNTELGTFVADLTNPDGRKVAIKKANEIATLAKQNGKRFIYYINSRINHFFGSGVRHNTIIVLDLKNNIAEFFDSNNDKNFNKTDMIKNIATSIKQSFPDKSEDKLLGMSNYFVENLAQFFADEEKQLRDFFNDLGMRFLNIGDYYNHQTDIQTCELIRCTGDEYKVTSAVGFCMVWGLLYLEMRVSNPDIPRREMIKYFKDRFVKNQDSKEICKLIRGYTLFLKDLE